MGVNEGYAIHSDRVDATTDSTNKGDLPAEKDKPKAKPRVRKTEQQQILEVLKNIQRLLAFPLKKYNVENETDAKFIERMNK
ncbi:hypothetical protein LCGC14_0547550 [marine sediment metagenome]|uniref:Uncharacterized protein n=1 Tax=marine sediment metagenome TaxID=412755 RepID=A0A0F9UZ22_9ZZZZ